MSAAITLNLPWPPSCNRYYRHNRGRTHVSAEGEQYRQLVQLHVFQQGKRIGPTDESRLAVHIAAYPPDKRRRDLDNLGKATLDAIVSSGVIRDDGDIDRLLFERREVVPGGKLLVTIERLP